MDDIRLIDTHAHLYVDAFSEDREEMLQRAWDAGVEQVFLPNIDQDSIPEMLALEEAHPERCVAMMGLHPCHVKEDYEAQLAEVKKWWEQRSFAAVGEIGIDLYWDKSTFEWQKDAFLRQVALAKKYGKPIVIHSREATQEVIELLEEEKGEDLYGIFHCFTGSKEEAEAIHELGFFLGIGGVVTFKNAGLDKTVQELPLEWLVLETDSPYLAPAPKRGKRNESAYVRRVAERIAAVKELPLGEVAKVTNRNARQVFALGEVKEGD